MTQVFLEDFTGNQLNPAIWQGGKPYAPLAAYPPNCQVANSMLRLTWNAGQNPTATEVFTIPAFATGLFEASIRWTPVTGAHPTFWGIPASGTPYPTPELDIMEGMGQFADRYYTTFHVWNKQTELSSNNATNTSKLVAPDWNKFHTYGAQWDGKTVTWFFDGVQVNAYTPPAGSPAQPLQLILSMHEAIAVPGAGWQSNNMTGVTVMSQSLLVDWVRVSQ